MPLQVDHIVPIASGGGSSEDNLWMACVLCNGYKGSQTQGLDAETGQMVPLFDPGRQGWNDHFAWNEIATEIVGRTPVGRATVQALRLNNRFVVAARLRWVAAGWHPPEFPTSETSARE